MNIYKHGIMAMVVLYIPLHAQSPSFKLGLENISHHYIQWLKSQSIGLVVNHTSKNQLGERTIDSLRQQEIPISRIFVPEHGLDGTIKAEHTVHDCVDASTGIPIISLYDRCTGKKPCHQNLTDIDVLMFDIQDIGMRHYTYISTLYQIMEAAIQHNKYCVVLDRPNPLGAVMEGPLVEEGLHSFIGIASIPLRHGMTTGELARYFNAYIFDHKAKLHVVPMQNYDRAQSLPATVSAHLSPNIQGKKSCYGYSFLGLLGEIRPCDVALGTEASFQCLLLPEQHTVHQHEWDRIQNSLKKLHIDSSIYSYFNERKKKTFHGLRIDIQDINKVLSFKTFITIISWLKKQGVALQCSDYFDKAAGTKKIREWIDGHTSLDNCITAINSSLYSFFEQAKPVLLYDKEPFLTPLVI